jgi:transposase InsO family protein
VAYVRTVKTASGATAVQIVWSSRRGSRSIEHLGSAHDEAELAALKAAAAERLLAGHAVLDLGVAGPPGSEPLPITSSQMTHLWDGLCAAYRIVGFESVTKGDKVFRDLVLARIIEPTSKIDYVSTWSGFAYVAFVVDAYARRILGWRVTSTMGTSMMLDKIEQAIWTRQQKGVIDFKDVVHHTDRGSIHVDPVQRAPRARRDPTLGRCGRQLV